MKVLYVEDNPSDIDLLNREFKRSKKDIVLDSVSTLFDAKEKLKEYSNYNILLIDMKLPDGNGLDLLSYIRQKAIPLPVIILTGYGDEDAAVLSIKAGADDYIPKKTGYYSMILDSIEKTIERYSFDEKYKEIVIKVLYVEHNKEDIDLTKRHIARYAPNIQIKFIESVEDALQKLLYATAQSVDFDIILLDYRLPGLTAIEMLKTIVEERKLDLPVIIVTGQGDEEIASHVLKLGASDYIVKNPEYLFKLPLVIQNAYDKVKLIKNQKELEKKNIELNNYFNNALDMLCISDMEGNFLRINKQWTDLLGYEIEEIYSRKFTEFIHEDDKQKAAEAILEMRRTNKILNLVTRYLGKNGIYRWLEWRSYKMDELVYSVARDISGRIESEELLRETNEYITKLLEYSNVPIIVWNTENTVTYFNRAFERITGYSSNEVYAGGLEIIIPENARIKTMYSIEQASMGILWENIEMPIQAKDGTEKCLLWNSANLIGGDNKTIVATIAQGMDITDRKTAEDRNKYLSIHDHLTGLYNRVYYEEKIKELDNEENLPLTVIFADVNGLKLANDAYGYKTGDALLCNAADAIKNEFRKEDTVVRMGGDEFVILMPKASTKEAETIVQRIRKKIVHIKIETIELSISFGIETKNKEIEILNDVLKNAENHMYRVKLFEGPSMRGKTIYAILNTLHEKNKREELHSRRVSKLSEMIGKALHMNESSINDLITAGLLHDIGKVAIEDSALNKTSELTTDESEEMKRHPEIGYRILSAVNDMADLAEYVLYHHERWDGKGYPKGLKGDKIPLQSRIITVADAYDAMTGPRPYRNALSEEDAKQELRINAGKQFDPEITRLFLEIMST